MKQFGITTKEGISIMVQQPHRGPGLHTEIHKKLRVQDTNLKPREALTESVLRVRKAYKENNRYAPQINEGLLEVIKQSKEKQPHLFNKKKE